MSHPTQSTLPDSVRQDDFQQRGFTLLEMVLVLFLIGLLASAGLLFTEGVEDQAKYDETKRRMELIRRAIVGDTTRTVNGAPEVSGFAADTGRLPVCIAELLYLEIDNPLSAVAPEETKYRSPCKPDDSNLALPYWYVDSTTGIGFGWRGPYIQTLADRNGEIQFRDGYGNDDGSENFGWRWQLFDKNDDQLDFTEAKSAVKANLQSLGFEATDPVDDIPKGDISDIPSLIVSNDWKVTLPNTVTVNFKNQSTSDLPISELTEKLLLRIYLSDLTEDENPYSFPITLSQSSVPASDIETKVFSIDNPIGETIEVALGNRAYAVVCYEVPSGDPDEYVIFDGDCEPTNIKPDSSKIRAFTVVPRNSLNLQLDWIIPTP